MNNQTQSERPVGPEQAEQLVQLQDHLMRSFLFQNRHVRKLDAPLPPQEVRVLFALASSGASRMGELARHLVVSVSSLTAIVNRLVARGFVARCPSGKDRRVVLVDLTPEGRRRHEERRLARLGMARAMLGALTATEQRSFLNLMRKIVSQTSLLLIFVGLSAGCQSVRQARAVQDSASMRPGERTVRWNELSTDPRAKLPVQEVVRLAISNSPAVFQARANLAVAESQLQEARSAYLPQVNLSSSYTRSKNYNPTTEASHSSRAGLSLGQELLSFGRQEAALRQARAQYAAAAAQIQTAVNTAAYQARLACYDLLQAQDLLLIASEKVREFTVHLGQVRIMADLGTRIRYDITKAEVDLGTARLEVLTASNTLLTAHAALGRVLGLTEEFSGVLVPPPPAPPPTDPNALFLLARRNNPDLMSLQHQSAAASAAVDYAVADLRPDLSFNTGFSWSGGAFPPGRNWSFGPSLDWSLFNGWRKTSALDAAATQLQISRARISAREQQLFMDLITARIQFQTARAQTELAEVIVRSARESLDLVSERYRLGLSTAVELTDAEVALAQTRTQQVQARRDELAAVALIRFNVGEGE